MGITLQPHLLFRQMGGKNLLPRKRVAQQRRYFVLLSPRFVQCQPRQIGVSPNPLLKRAHFFRIIGQFISSARTGQAGLEQSHEGEWRDAG